MATANFCGQTRVRVSCGVPTSSGHSRRHPCFQSSPRELMARQGVNVSFSRDACCCSASQHSFLIVTGSPAGWAPATFVKKAARKVSRRGASRLVITPVCMAPFREFQSNAQGVSRGPPLVWAKLLKESNVPCPETVWNMLLEAVASDQADLKKDLNGGAARGTVAVDYGRPGSSSSQVEAVEGSADSSQDRSNNGAGISTAAGGESSNGAGLVIAEREGDTTAGMQGLVEEQKNQADGKNAELASPRTSVADVAVSRQGEGKKRGLSNLMANAVSGVKDSAAKKEVESARVDEPKEEPLLPGSPKGKPIGPSRVKKISSQAQLDTAVKSANDRLLVLLFAAKDDKASKLIFSTMSTFSRLYQDVDFLVVIGDESDETREFCRSVNVSQGPHFMFFYHGKKIRESSSIGEDELYSSVIYYSNPSVTPLVNIIDRRERLDELLAENKGSEDKLLVISVCLHDCWPCVRVYGTFNNLSKQMKDIAVFARLIGDTNEGTLRMLKEFKILEVPTFLFARDGEIVGRYVGSGKGDLIGEILRHQGVKSHIR